MRDARHPRIVVAALMVSGVGHVIHNLAEFPVAILLGWETLFPIAITVLLAISWYRLPGRAVYATMTAWAGIVLVFGGGSVIPFGFLPFVPEQSGSHYAAHLIYAVAQLPLLWVGYRGFRSDSGDVVKVHPDRKEA